MPETSKDIKTILTSDAQVDIQNVVNDPKVLKLYGNGFTFGHSLSDATIVIQLGTTPVALLNLSFIALKTLSVSLADLISQIEANLGEPIKDIATLRNNVIKKQ